MKAAMMKTGLGMMAVIAIAGTGAVSASDRIDRIVQLQLEEGARFFADEGYVMLGAPRYGALGHGGEDRIPFRIRAGVNHVFYAVCDMDCDDLDLLLLDHDGSTLTSDLLPDDVPIVEYTPVRDMQVTVVVRMASCDIAPCAYGVSLLVDEQ
ncbi:hypothetical protein [Isoalcanivorax indicus]|uniref:hypothetical protein n=1 Tax=Isoalcanivorax indicus TaxID=2202653 RepID=UPI000DBA756D|nr:hypothetical protein [Isoalcanivorax indicus]